MQFDDGISVPTHYLNPEHRLPLVPVTMNCTVPPIAGARLSGGRTLRDALRAYPGSERIAVVATGGYRTSQEARDTSGWTRSSIAGSSTC